MPRFPGFVRSASCAFGVIIAGASPLLAGPLNPPAGPVASSGKTLVEVEPRMAVNAANTPGDADSRFKITQPGSYYLTGNITGVAGKHGIEIAASGVMLDLNGFDLAGIPGMGAFDGVSVSVDSLRGISVVNGSVRNWGDGGVDLGFLSRGCRVEGVVASGNAGTGITSSISSAVTNCTAAFNGQRGIRASNGSTISNCSVESNTGNGIEVNHGCTITNCSAYFNTLTGIFAGSGCSLADCSSYQNLDDGIQVGEGSTVSRCSVLSNAVRGIDAGARCTISGCTASFSGTDGISAGLGCTVLQCSAYNNGGNGIDADGLGTTVIDCKARSNTLHGIHCSFVCVVRGNTCSSNGSSGIHASAAQNRIEGNHCIANLRGIDVDVGGNIIIGNTCSGNVTNWDIAGSNKCLVVLGVNAAGFSGDSGGISPGSTNPWANFTF